MPLASCTVHAHPVLHFLEEIQPCFARLCPVGMDLSSELYSAPRLSFSVALRLNSLLSWQLEGGQRSYTQFQNVGIKNKLNAETLQMAQLTPPSWRVGAACDSRTTLAAFDHVLRPFLITTQNSNKTCFKSFFFSSTHFYRSFGRVPNHRS